MTSIDETKLAELIEKLSQRSPSGVKATNSDNLKVINCTYEGDGHAIELDNCKDPLLENIHIEITERPVLLNYLLQIQQTKTHSTKIKILKIIQDTLSTSSYIVSYLTGG